MPEQITTYPERLLQINSLRRAGQHLLVEYLAGCLVETGLSWAHANDVDNNLKPGHPDRKEWTVESVLAAAAGQHTLITNYEDYSYTDRHKSPIYSGLRDIGTPSRDIILLRDFPNLASTRIARLAAAEQKGQHHKIDVFSLWHARDIWIDHAQTALAAAGDANGPTVVLYNRLIDRGNAGLEYRQGLAKRLGLVNSDAGLDRVPGFGGGSSIDGQKFHGRPQHMNVLGRWRDLDPSCCAWLLDVIDDPEVDTLNRELFGFGVAEVVKSVASAAYTLA